MAEPKRGAIPSQTTPNLRLASQLNAQQQQERIESQTPWTEEAAAQQQKPVFLQQPTRSYTQSRKKTESESFMDEQRKMTETATQFSGGGFTQDGQMDGEREAAPVSGVRQRALNRRQESTGTDAALTAEEQQIQAEENELIQAQQVMQLQQMAARAQDEQLNAEQKLQKGYSLIQQTKSEWQNIRQMGEVASGVGVFMLVLELNIQTLSALFNKDIPFVEKASKPRMIITACVDCNCCLSQMWMMLPILIFVLIAMWFISSPGDAIWTALQGWFG